MKTTPKLDQAKKFPSFEEAVNAASNQDHRLCFFLTADDSLQRDDDSSIPGEWIVSVFVPESYYSYEWLL